MALVRRFLKHNMKRLYALILLICSAAGPIYAHSPDQDTLNRNLLIKVEPFRLSIISPSAGVQFYRDGLVFLSHSRDEDRMLQNHISFGKPDTYFIVYNDTIPGDHTLFSPSGSFNVPSDAMTFNSDYTLMYYSKKPSRKNPEKIYRARSEGSDKPEWISDPEPLNICSGNSTYSHPSLSSDGEMMVFSSNMEGVGGFDIFFARMDGSDWSSPVNAGSVVNTFGDEVSPLLDQDNNLFFSSDRRPGTGGLDIFFSRYNGSGWEKPVNLTEMINTDNDELAFTLDRSGGQSAFFTRRNKSGKGPLKLYRVTFFNKTAASQLKNLSNAFQYLAVGNLAKPAPAAPASTTAVKTSAEKEQQVAASIKTETLPETKTAVGKAQTRETGKTETPVTQKTVQPKQEASKIPPAKQAITGGIVVYRVQFLANPKPKGSYEITIGGTKYKTFEYLYNGAYRSCAGEFANRTEAFSLQKAFRQAGYADAFVVAFKNNVRSMDPSLFK